jgi:hypothetical protein
MSTTTQVIIDVLNDNQGVVAVTLFALTVIAAWVSGLIKFLYNKFIYKGDELSINPQLTTSIPSQRESFTKETNAISGQEKRKRLTNILFVDDKKMFNVVSILKTSGWKNTKIKADLKSLDENDLAEANICFIDVQGVGRLLRFKDEGLGLALAIKRKYPLKKVVIYSAQSEGDRFHEALQAADALLRKDADPYEFQNLVEEFSKEINS